MSSRTWWKSSSRDFMPSRYTEIRKAAVRAATAGPPGSRADWVRGKPTCSQAAGLEQPPGSKAKGIGSET